MYFYYIIILHYMYFTHIFILYVYLLFHNHPSYHEFYTFINYVKKTFKHHFVNLLIFPHMFILWNFQFFSTCFLQMNVSKAPKFIYIINENKLNKRMF
jgi:hypothetical protein